MIHHCLKVRNLAFTTLLWDSSCVIMPFTQDFVGLGFTFEVREAAKMLKAAHPIP